MNNRLHVGFYGHYIPLQGADCIIEAARLLAPRPEISFTLLGSGQTRSSMEALAHRYALPNVTFVERIAYEELPAFIRSCDVMLGIFGPSGKAARVIPNKVYEAAAVGAAIVTADTPAIREVFTDREDILLCGRADPKDLAAKIELLAGDSALRERIGAGARERYLAVATPARIGAALLGELERLP